jgi:hypothetical protein
MVGLIGISEEGCATQASKEEVDKLIDQRLAERGLAPLPSGSSSAVPAPSASSSPSSPGNDPVNTSAAFLARLDELMRDYRPALPVVEDKSDQFRCVTTDTANSNADVKKAMGPAPMERRFSRII